MTLCLQIYVVYTLLYIVDELTSRRGNLFFLVDEKIVFLVDEENSFAS